MATGTCTRAQATSTGTVTAAGTAATD